MQNARKDVIDFFEKGIFPYRGNVPKTKEESEENKFFEYIENESKGINYDLFRNYFDFAIPSALAQKLFKIKYKKKSNDFVTVINNRWSNLKNEIEKMSEEERENEKPDKILKIVEEILEFNKKYKNNQKKA